MVEPGDSLRVVLDSVFAAPAYRWVEPTDPFAALRLRFCAAGRLDQASRVEQPSPLHRGDRPAGPVVGGDPGARGAGWCGRRCARRRRLPRSCRTRRSVATPTGTGPKPIVSPTRADSARPCRPTSSHWCSPSTAGGPCTSTRARRRPSTSPSRHSAAGRTRSSAALVRQLYRIVFGGWRVRCRQTYAEWRRHAAPERYAAAH